MTSTLICFQNKNLKISTELEAKLPIHI